MSLFLGPIHYWLYNKIQLQEDFTQFLLRKQPEAYKSLDNSCQAPARCALEEVIDTGNIHGWLQGQVTIVENRFAAAVAKLLDSGVTPDAIQEEARSFGSSRPISASTAAEVFAQLQNLLLDGMPCDHVNQVSVQTDEEVIWIRTTDIHASYWEKEGLTSDIYYQLRAAFVEGMLDGSGFALQMEDNRFCIRKM